MKKLLSIILAILMVATTVPYVFAADVIASGECGADGNNLTWVLDSTGTLTISGEGKMKDYSSGRDIPWYEYAQYSSSNKFNTVVIENGVTSIGNYAFYSCKYFRSVTIPDSVTSIGHYVFIDCFALTDVTIPDSVTSIGDCAFQSCKALTSITIPDSVTSLGRVAFSNCTGLTSVTLGNGVKEIDEHAFQGCTEIKELTMPASAKIFNSSETFADCTKIEKVTLTKGTGTMHRYNIDASSSWTSTKTYFKYTPWYISGCSTVIIEEGVSDISQYAFCNSKNLTEIFILDPNCSIYDEEETIYSGAKIYGYAGSGAQAYAEKYSRAFIAFTACPHEYLESYCLNVPEVKATCTEVGYTSGTYCTLCEKWLSGHRETPALNHSWANLDGICANGCGLECLHENQTGGTCEVCGASLHVCDFSGEWKYDAYKHWKECECGLKSEEGTHSDSMVICTEKAVCETCGAEYEEKDKIIHDETVEYVNGFCPNCDDYEPAVDSDSDGYYEIGNAGQLYWFADKVKNDRTNYSYANAILTQNIVVNENVLTADGKLNGSGSDFRAWIPPYAYKGTFDGAGKTVSGLYFKDTEERDVGFIGYLYGGTVKNLTVKDSYFNAYSAVGGIVGSVIKGTVTDCFSSATVIAGSLGYAGGIAGENGAGLVERCANSGFVTSGNEAGGIVGYNHNYYDDPDPAIIHHCYNIGSVSGYTVGGIVGYAVQKMGSSVEIDSCWAACELNGTNSVGGLIGHASGSTIRCCIYDKTVFTGNPVGKKTSCNIFDSGFKSTEEFASGDAAYLLNGKSSGGFWRQTIGTDAYPGFSGDKVYYGYISCADNAKKGYTNDATATEVKPAHNWSNNDGICANGCGYECPHESYTDGVCDNCSYECPHEWGEGVLTRPVHDAVLGSKDGYYTYTCTVCGKEKKETVKSADYSAYEAVSEEINALLQSDELTDAAKQEIYSAANECGLLSDELTESEQNIVDDLVAELEKIVADAEEKIASGEYVKVDGFAVYNERGRQWLLKFNDDGVYEKATEIILNLTDEANAKMEEMYAFALSLEGSVAENAENIAKLEADIDEFFGQIENCLDGVHNGFVYEVTEEAKCEVNAIESATCTLCGETDEREVEGSALKHSFTKYEETEAPKCGVAGKEVAYCDNGCQTTDEREIPALEHIFLDYVSNGDATCTADGTKTAECINSCGATDTVADEGTKLSHTDEDGDKLCDSCGEQYYCKYCGREVHEENGIAQYICVIIMFVKLVVSFVKMLQGAAA
ncbi:MAG: leucine-rich repeat protein [Clostridia bacterium]|nr:leucine-rich repeat protein [Clostridia bacterium]